MADNDEFSDLELSKTDIDKVILIQALFRGALVRKWIKEVKQAYETLVTELEINNRSLGVAWQTKHLCKPKVCKKSKIPPENQLSYHYPSFRSDHRKQPSVLKQTHGQKQDKKVVKETSVSPRLAAVEAEGTGTVILDCDKGLNCETLDADSLKFYSVETQTSLIEINTSREKHEKDSGRDVNILDDIDTSWKDRLEPFVSSDKNEPSEDGTVVSDENKEDLHLHLSSERESLRSPESDGIHAEHEERAETPEGSEIGKTLGLPQGEDKIKTGLVLSGRSEGSGTYRSERSDVGDEVLRSPRSDRSSGCRSQRSNKSERSEGNSQVSSRSYKSDGGRSQRRNGSEQSDESHRYKSRRSGEKAQQRRQRSGKAEEEGEIQKVEEEEHSDGSKGVRPGEAEHLNQSRIRERPEQHQRYIPPSSRSLSPSPRQQIREESVSRGKELRQHQASLSLTNVTSVWDSCNSIRESHDLEMPKVLPEDPGMLRELRKNVAMELLWVQQAIDSRKNYLRLKNQM